MSTPGNWRDSVPENVTAVPVNFSEVVAKGPPDEILIQISGEEIGRLGLKLLSRDEKSIVEKNAEVITFKVIERKHHILLDDLLGRMTHLGFKLVDAHAFQAGTRPHKTGSFFFSRKEGMDKVPDKILNFLTSSLVSGLNLFVNVHSNFRRDCVVCHIEPHPGGQVVRQLWLDRKKNSGDYTLSSMV